MKNNTTLINSLLSIYEINTHYKNIGLVFIAIAFKNQCIFRKFNFNLNRDLNRKISCYAALNILRKMIQNEC